MKFYNDGSLVIRKVINGFVIEAKGSLVDQEDNKDGEYAFTNIRDLLDWMNEYYSDDEKSR